MAQPISAERFRFLFRQDRGTIDAATWRPAAAGLGAIFAVCVAVEWLANRSNKTIGIGATAIFILFVMVIAAAYYFLGAKRFRDRGRPPLLALILPIALLLDASLHFLQPVSGGYFPLWFATTGDIVLAGILVWNVVELGFLGQGKPPA